MTIKIELGKLIFTVSNNGVEVCDDPSREGSQLHKSLVAVFRSIIFEHHQAGINISNLKYVAGLNNAMNQLDPPTDNRYLLMAVLHLYMLGGDHSLKVPFKLLSENDLGEDHSDFRFVRKRAFFRECSPSLLTEMIENTYKTLAKDVERLQVDYTAVEIAFLVALDMKSEVAIVTCFIDGDTMQTGSCINVDHPSMINPAALFVVNRQGLQENIEETEMWSDLNGKVSKIPASMQKALDKWC